MSIESDVKHDVRNIKHDVKNIVTDIKHTVRPPWYRRAWNRVRRMFRRR